MKRPGILLKKKTGALVRVLLIILAAFLINAVILRYL